MPKHTPILRAKARRKERPVPKTTTKFEKNLSEGRKKLAIKITKMRNVQAERSRKRQEKGLDDSKLRNRVTQQRKRRRKR